ncbi:MAG: ATP-binding protein [Lachnospiraceae bacterium]|nr:ATP-binding protein [Lachnospiraceae bacterium]
MGLTNRQYDLLRHSYDIRTLQAKLELERRREEVYAAHPDIKEIEEQIASDSIKRARLAIKGDKSALDHIDEDNAALKARKESLLVSYGYPADHLLPHYVCPLCHDTGFIDNVPCECYKRAVSEMIYNDSNLSGILKEQNFDNFDYDLYSSLESERDPNIGMTPRENIERAVEISKDFIASFDTDFRNLLIYGNTGVGKTFLCSCIAKELLDSSHIVVYYTAYKFFKLLEKDKFQNDDTEGDVPGPEFLIDCDLFILDDLGTELTNSFTNSALYSVLNERELKKHPTVISTNLSLADLNSRYSERVFSRLNKDYTFIKIIGRDIRCL